ncbi:MAG: LytTR family transcriptional regulator DNA-binding domain-containing protein [Bacilli bacterium]|jgi:DNA-binding LytR/AlgR family response regulator
MTNIAFVESSATHKTLFENYVFHFGSKCPEKLVTKFFSNSTEFYANKDVFDMVFFDAETNDPTNSEIALKVKRKYPHAAIIILTKESQDILEFNSFDGLFFKAKPISYPEFISLMKSIMAYVKRSRVNSVDITTSSNENVTLKTNDIIYLEYKEKETIYHTANKDYVTKSTPKEAERDFLYDSFFEVNCYYFVNMRYLTGISSDDVTVEGKPLAIPKMRKSQFLSVFTSYMSFIIG